MAENSRQLLVIEASVLNLQDLKPANRSELERGPRPVDETAVPADTLMSAW